MGTSENHLDKIIALFDWFEYLILSCSIFVCVLVGVYFGFIRKQGQNTVDGYMLGNKKMQLIPVSFSLVASLTSGITMIGFPSEVYFYGLVILGNVVGVIVSTLATNYIFLPIFFKLQLLSLYEYLERRFDHRVRKTVSTLAMTRMVVWAALSVYIPSLIMNQVSAVNVHLSTFVASLVCVFYTTVGGLKAVVWTDTIQTVMMVGAMVMIVVAGTGHVGGFTAVMEAAYESGRLEFFKWDFSLTERLSFWSSSLGFSFLWISSTACYSPVVQRFYSLPTEKLAAQSSILMGVGTNFFAVISAYMGLVMYKKYQFCDPMMSGITKKPDQIAALFILESVGHLKGIPGIFLASIFAGGLSTMSTCINSAAIILYEDFVVPFMKEKPHDSIASKHMKIIAFIFGLVIVALGLLVEQLGAVMEISMMLGGGISGAMVAAFLLGVLVPFANSKGVLMGLWLSMLYITWITIGFSYYVKRGLIKYPTKVTSVEKCDFNITYAQTTEAPPIDEYVNPMFKVSMFWYSMLTFGSTLIIGIAVSALTGGRNSSTDDPDLYHPSVHWMLKKKNASQSDSKTYEEVPLEDYKSDAQ